MASLGRPRKAFSERLMCMQPPQMDGSQEAYEEFFARLNRSVLLRIAAPIVHDDSAAAEDVVQQALLRAYRHLTKGQSYAAPRQQFQHVKNSDPEHASLDLNLPVVQIQNPAAWLYTIVHNTACNYVRKRKVALVSLEEVMREAERKESCFAQPERDTIRQQQAQELRRYVAALPSPFADIVRLYSVEGQPL
ncbi:RNA polymerase sigma factor [Dictyobacter formicarum]|uniref:RNA polymerase sigma-70 region 2 domain-containing protein n=1 Tax=Dictyobacter formicarum TaxID=2778368 RepID=A0ABQ3VMV2_9CHLR|nr:hypothetical protein [Dictyobacter formicarum]GHO87557.1 hypothetical protein KSZ_55630 [Dictyobacter formicarum]